MLNRRAIRSESLNATAIRYNNLPIGLQSKDAGISVRLETHIRRTRALKARQGKTTNVSPAVSQQDHMRHRRAQFDLSIEQQVHRAGCLRDSDWRQSKKESHPYTGKRVL